MNPGPAARAGSNGVTVASEALKQRELEVARDIAHAFLNASQPLEVYRLALARVTPLVGASFGSVFLRDSGDRELLKLVCAHNWPQSSARFLGQLRIRIGRGPTGRAVMERRAVDVEDVFADPALREWWDPAREMGFASLIALPLEGTAEAIGALSFYFEEPHRFDDEERELLGLIADQLAATAERAHLIEDLRAANERLNRQNRELEERVREAEQARRLKDEFLANMSHELRTPLTSILGYAYLLNAGHVGELSGQQGAALKKIERAGTVLLGLISDLLELSQLKLGRARVVPGAHEAAALAQRAVELAGSPPAEVGFRMLRPDGPIPLEVDGEKAVKILENLLSNAFKFTSRGEVTLTVRCRRGGPAQGGGWSTGAAGVRAREDGWVEWLIQDTGIGVRAEDLDVIFDEFRQVDGSSTRLYGGTGLGLALSRRLAHLLGGEIVVESEPGVGSTFTLRLPLTAPLR